MTYEQTRDAYRRSRGNVTQRGIALMNRLGVAGKADICSTLHRAAVRYIRIQEEACSGPRWTWSGSTRWEWSQEWQDAIELADARCEARIRELVAQLGEGFGVNFSGDPRGCCVYVTTPDRRNDSFGGDGVCVVTEDID